MSDATPQQPIVHTLVQWSVLEVPPPEGLSKWTRHFAGLAGDKPFISDPVVAFDAANACAYTHSGQLIQLVGEPDWPKEVRQMWAAWKLLQRVSFERDVTSEFHAGLMLVRSEG